ncbi:MAG: TlpA family protein disulfide reductase [Gammaproteobacteria bacterium]
MNNSIKIVRVCLVLVCCVFSSAAIPGAVNGTAPEFTLTDASGKPVSLSTFQGQVVMVNFWASWCGPCRQEMPILDELYQKYSPLGFSLLGVNVEQSSADARAYLQDTTVSFPVLFDPKNEVSKAYDVIAMPSTVLIDRAGNMRYLHHGYKPGYENDYQDQIRELIRE